MLALYALVISVQAQSDKQAKVWSLQECIDYALENNLLVQDKELVMNTGEVNLKESKMGMLPTLNANAQYGRNWGRSINPETNTVTTLQQDNGFGGITLSWLVFNGGRVHNRIKQDHLSLEANKYDLQKTKNDVILNVITFYTNVIFNKELLENSKSQLASSQKQADRTRKQVAAGALALANLKNLEAQVATNEVSVINAENQVNLSILQLKQSMQLPANEELDVAIPEIQLDEADLAGVNPQTVYDIAESTLPEVKSADLQIQSAAVGEKVAKSGFYPRLTFSGQLNTNYSSLAADRGLVKFTGNKIDIPIGFVQGAGTPVLATIDERTTIPYTTGAQLNDNFGKSVGMGISIPIFNNYSVNSNVQRAKIARERAEVFAEQTRQTLRQIIETASNDVLSASKAYQSSLKQVEAQEESFRATKQRYDNGAANYTDYQVAENTLFQAKSDLLRAKYDYIFKLKILDFYQGKSIEF